MRPPMLFSEILDSLEGGDGAWTSAVSEDWMQGRSVFGGLQGALALRAMRAFVPREIPLRALQVVFVAPVEAGRVSLRAETLRTGKNVVHVEARILAGGRTSCMAVGVFGRGRASQVELLPRPPPRPSPERPPTAWLTGVGPSFT